MQVEIPLRGPSGEPVDFARTVFSHGCTRLAPALHVSDSRYDVMLRIGKKPLRASFTPAGADLRVEVQGKPSAKTVVELKRIARRMFRLDDDFAHFYALASSDPELAWVTAGAGRMMSSPTVFEDVVKTICTTNCAWSGTVRMVGAIVNHTGAGAFPTPDEMAAAPPSFYTDVARAGYRGPYLTELAKNVSSGRLDLEVLRPEHGLPDDEVEERLHAINGVGPYACAHIMMLLGRHRRLVLDSWTRPTYLKLAGKKKLGDPSIVKRFKRYGDFAGLAFWLTVTRDWL